MSASGAGVTKTVDTIDELLAAAKSKKVRRIIVHG
jgi:hypothetical protein